MKFYKFLVDPNLLLLIIKSNSPVNLWGKVAEPGTNCKRISKWFFSNFNASPLTEKKSPWIYWGLSIFFSLYNLVHFYPLMGDDFFSRAILTYLVYNCWKGCFVRKFWRIWFMLNVNSHLNITNFWKNTRSQSFVLHRLFFVAKN
jgi:hypothetical protein